MRLFTFSLASTKSCLINEGPISLNTSFPCFKKSNSFLTTIFSCNCASNCCRLDKVL